MDKMRDEVAQDIYERLFRVGKHAKAKVPMNPLEEIKTALLPLLSSVMGSDLCLPSGQGPHQESRVQPSHPVAMSDCEECGGSGKTDCGDHFCGCGGCIGICQACKGSGLASQPSSDPETLGVLTANNKGAGNE